MKFHAWAMSHRGLKRASNQDTCLIDEELGLYVVADGMGGHQGGEVASKLAVETLRDSIRKNREHLSPTDLLTLAYREASFRIYDEADRNRPELKGMGTTLVCVYLAGERFYFGNVGDSRAYLYKSSKMWPLTDDHSLLNEQLKAGLLEEKDVDKFVGKNVITRSVGYEPSVECDVVTREPQPGEIYLLCSDGLYGLVSDEKISELLSSTPGPQIPTSCIDEALAAGGDDNVTVLAIRVDDLSGKNQEKK